MRAQEALKQTNISATTAAFEIKGGKYGVSANATFGGGSVKLQRALPDGSGYVSVGSSTDFTAAGYATVDLPQGNYRWTITTATAVYAEIIRIPGE